MTSDLFHYFLPLLPPTAGRLPENLQPACTLGGLLQGGGSGRQPDEGGECWSPDLPPARRHGVRPRHPRPPEKQPRRPEDDEVWQKTRALMDNECFFFFLLSYFSFFMASSGTWSRCSCEESPATRRCWRCGARLPSLQQVRRPEGGLQWLSCSPDGHFGETHHPSAAAPAPQIITVLHQKPLIIIFIVLKLLT